MVLAHSRALKTGARAAVVQADIRAPATILDHPDTRRLIDFGEPVVLLMVAILHFISDADRPAEIIAAFRDAVVPGSYLILSHASGDMDAANIAKAGAIYRTVAADTTLREARDVLRFFDGFALLEPGLVPVGQWRPEEAEATQARQAWMLGGVGRKPD
jgi:hypothetical protein